MDAFLTSAVDAVEWLSALCTCLTVGKEINWDLQPFWPREIHKENNRPAGNRSPVLQPFYYYCYYSSPPLSTTTTTATAAAATSCMSQDSSVIIVTKAQNGQLSNF